MAVRTMVFTVALAFSMFVAFPMLLVFAVAFFSSTMLSLFFVFCHINHLILIKKPHHFDKILNKFYIIQII